MHVRSCVLGSVCVRGGGGGEEECLRACVYVEVCVWGGGYHLRILRVSAPAVTKQSCQP